MAPAHQPVVFFPPGGTLVGRVGDDPGSTQFADGAIDDGVTNTYYEDYDGDGYWELTEIGKLFRELFVLVLSRATESDAHTHPAEIATVQAVIKEELGELAARLQDPACRLLTHGPFAGRHWGVGVVVGIVLPLPLLALGSPLALLAAATTALVGLWFEEDVLVRAGQALPIS